MRPAGTAGDDPPGRDYPGRLREIAAPPAVLYIRGRVFRFDEEAAIGVVGSRDPSPYGERVAAQLGLELARGGALLVSGIAQGIDSTALKGALKGGGPVVSVLAGGVDVPTPARTAFCMRMWRLNIRSCASAWPILAGRGSTRR